MAKFIDRAIGLLNSGDMDGLQTELHDLEQAWKTCNGLRNSLQENNVDLVERNNELVLAAQQSLFEKKRIVDQYEKIQDGLKQQMIRAEIARQAELNGLVEDNVKLRGQVRQLEQDLRRKRA